MNPPIVYRKPKGSRAASPSTSNIITNEAGPSKPKPVRKVISNSNESFIGRRKGTMPGPWLSFLDNILEGEDFEESLLAVEGMVGTLFSTSISHTRQLLALALSPYSCLPSKQSTEKRVPSTNSDPFIPTRRKIRIASLRLLELIANSTGAETIFRAAPGYDPDSSIDTSLDGTNSSTISAQTNGKQKRSRVEDDDDEDDEDEGPFYLAGKRVGKLDDLWDFLAGMAENNEGTITRSREEPIASGGWEMLRSFVGIWEEEASVRKATSLSPIAPSLLRQFKPAISGPREVSSKILEVIFWPFTHEEPLSNSATSEDLDEMSIGEKRIVSGRIVALLAQLSLAGNLELPSFERGLIETLQRLPESAFADFLENLHFSPSLFTIRLCTSYLDLYSHHTKPVSSASLIGTNISPRRKALGASLSSNSLSQGLDSSSLSNQSTSKLLQLSTVNSEYFQSPNVSNILNLLAKIPSTVAINSTSEPSTSVPLPAVVAVVGARRAPKARASVASKNSNSAVSVQEKSLRIFKLVKETLITVVLDWDENDLIYGGGKERLTDGGLSIEKMKEVMEEVERIVPSNKPS